MLYGLKKEVADMIFRRGAIKFGSFKFKHHEENPEAELAPNKINLRTKSHPKDPGPLDDKDCELLAQGLKEMISGANIKFDAITGLPFAGNPLAEALARITGFNIIPLAKKEEEGKRSIILEPGFIYQPPMIVLPIDDVITLGRSKFEAITPLRLIGMIVEHLAVIVDRQEGGVEDLAQMGCKILAFLKMSELLYYGYEIGGVSFMNYMNSMNYMHNSREKRRGQ